VDCGRGDMEGWRGRIELTGVKNIKSERSVRMKCVHECDEGGKGCASLCCAVVGGRGMTPRNRG
jgi:hypothetical protein